MAITQKQRGALELFFTILADQFNELGETFKWEFGGLSFNLKFTRFVVRDMLWKPIQKVLFDIDTTKDLDTKKIDMVIDVLADHFGSQGYEVEFPSQQKLLNEIDRLNEIEKEKRLKQAQDDKISKEAQKSN